MRYLLLFSLTTLIWACQSEPAPATDNSPPSVVDTIPTEATTTSEFLLEPGQGFGELKPGLTTAALRALLGDEQIREEDFYLGEGYFEPGLLLYPDTDRELAVHLANDTVNLVRLAQDRSAWQTAQGITIGSTLQEVVAANGKAFELMGFEWDYGGTVTDWKGGTYADQDLLMRFTVSYGKERLPAEDVQAIMGDQVISSNHPTLAKYLVTVVEITQR